MDVEYELSAKRVELNVLEAERDAEELWEYDEYQRLQRQIAELEERVQGEETDSVAANSDRTLIESET